MTQAQTSSATEIYIAPQTTIGQVGTPVFNKFPTTSGRLNKNVTFVKSATIRQDGQATRNIRDSVALASEFAFELTEDILLLLKGALRCNADPLDENINRNTISFDASANEINSSANAFGLNLGGKFVLVSGAANPELNKVYYVISGNQTQLIVSPGSIPADEAAGEFIRVRSTSFESGKSVVPYVFQEREEIDGGGFVYTTQIDCIINTLSITIPQTGVVTCTMGIVAGTQLNQTTQVAGATTNLFVEKQPVSNLDMIWYPDQVEADEYKFTDATIDINSNSEAISAAGLEGAVCNTVNTITVGGSLNSITRSDAPREELNKKENGTVFGMSYLFSFESGDKLSISTKRMRYTEGSRERTTDAVSNFSGTYDAETLENETTIMADYMTFGV